MSNYHYYSKPKGNSAYCSGYFELEIYPYSKLGGIEPSDVTELSDSDCTVEVSADLANWRIAFMWLIYGLRFGFQHPGINRLQVN